MSNGLTPARAGTILGAGLCSAANFRKRRHSRCCALSAIAITRNGGPWRQRDPDAGAMLIVPGHIQHGRSRHRKRCAGHLGASDFQLVTINGAPGLLMRHPVSGNGTYSFDIADGRIRAIYVVRNPDQLRGFLEHTH